MSKDKLHPLYRWSLCMLRICNPIIENIDIALERIELKQNPLSNCPSCGSNDVNDYDDWENYWVKCDNCGLQTDNYSGCAINARKKWNDQPYIINLTAAVNNMLACKECDGRGYLLRPGTFNGRGDKCQCRSALEELLGVGT